MKREAGIVIGLIAITLIAFHELGQCGFVNFDDPGYTFRNPHVTTGLSPKNFVWAWTTFDQGNYLPLTWLSLMLNVTLFGNGASGFHWVNVGFHAANVVLLYLFFRRATGAVWRSALVAALFAVHPLRVESVAWIVERKDVLTAFFWLMAGLAYAQYVRSLKWTWYSVTLLLFAAALLAKQTLSTLPFLLLLLDYWPLGRWIKGPAAVGDVKPPRRSATQLVVEKLPLFLMGAGIILITMRAQASTHSIANLQDVSLSYRVTNVPVSYARYLLKTVWPTGLAILYPSHHWRVGPIAAACAVLAAITAFCVWKFRSRPWLMIGWLWFLGVLFPMIGVIQFGPQAMADRFTYVAGIGVLVMAVWSIPEAAGQNPVRVVAGVVTTLGVLIVMTIAQTRYWHDSVALFDHSIAVAGSCAPSEQNLAVALIARGRLPEAITHLKLEVREDPHKATARGALAAALEKTHQLGAAIIQSRLAVRHEPDKVVWRMQLADLLVQSKQYQEAESECRKAVALNSSSDEAAEAHRGLGIALCKMGKTREGVEEFKMALAIEPEMKTAELCIQKYQNQAATRPSTAPSGGEAENPAAARLGGDAEAELLRAGD